MSKRLILVYDDNENLGKKYKQDLEAIDIVIKNFDVQLLTDNQMRDEIVKLTRRQDQVRNNGNWTGGRLMIDDADIFFIDFDLLKFNVTGPFMTMNGENISYLARCFSHCGLIIGINRYLSQFGDNPFDLTLKGDLESFADVNIGGRQVSNRGLWECTESKEFRPWYWPLLLDYLKKYETKVKLIRKKTNSKVLPELGLETLTEMLPRSAIEFLGAKAYDTTFRDFVTSSGNGLMGRDRKANDTMVARVAASRLSKWMERVVLPGEDILVDAPHLVSRFPSLLEGNQAEIKSWNRTTNLHDGVRLGIKYEKIEAFRYTKSIWLDRSAWVWPSLSNYQEIEEIAEPWKSRPSLFAFCEDVSLFLPRKQCIEFVAELDSPYVRRFIRKFEDVDYEPRVRLVKKTT